MASPKIALVVLGVGVASQPVLAQRLDGPPAIPSGDVRASSAPGAPYPVPGGSATPGVPAPSAPSAPGVQVGPRAPLVQRDPATAPAPVAPPPPVTIAPASPPPPRWGEPVGGRWAAGSDAPGGWDAYREPRRGRRLPGYWLAPRFALNDYADYGLPVPPYGYRWSRYYDDAVLIDWRGKVLDSAHGIDWNRQPWCGGYGTEPQVHVEGPAHVRVYPGARPGCGYGHGYGYGYGYSAGPVTTTTIVIEQPAQPVTTVRYVTEKLWVPGRITYRTVRASKAFAKRAKAAPAQAKPAKRR